VACDPYRKIGLATDSRARLNGLQVGSPHLLTLERAKQTYSPMAGQVERRVHEALGDRRIRGEWFEVDAQTAAELVILWTDRANAFLRRLAAEINGGRREWIPNAPVEPLPRKPREPRPRPASPGRVVGKSRHERLASYKAARGL
jgi:hypothetical protein